MKWMQFLGAVMVAWFVQLDSAWACAQSPTEIYNSYPKAGETHPANYALIFQGESIEPELLSVTVAGRPAELVSAYDVSPQAWRIAPMPTPGDTVIIDGKPCRETAFECQPFSLTFTAGDPQNTPPKPPASAYFSVHEYPTSEEGRGDCEEESEFTVYTQIDKGENEDLALMEVTLFDRRAPKPSGPRFFFGLRTRVNFSIGQMLVSTPATPTIDDARNYCLRITTRNLGGQESEPMDFCIPCAYHADDDMWESAGEPNWDDATKAGGACTAEDAKGQTPEVTENTPVYEPEQTPAGEAVRPRPRMVQSNLPQSLAVVPQPVMTNHHGRRCS